MFRSIWENGERGTPEQWKIKPKTNLYYSFKFNINSILSIIRLFSFGSMSPFYIIFTIMHASNFISVIL